MTLLIDRLPGIAMPVSEVAQAASAMWQGEAGDGERRLSDFHASQMNLVLHCGLETTAKELERRFESMLAFTQRYPCRLIVLCPQAQGRSDVPLQGKLYSQCFMGASRGDVLCCEALMLSYPLDTSVLLDHQVSLWLDADLPVYHWFHRVPAKRIEQHYLPFIKRCRRVIFDRDIEGDAYDAIAWPSPDRVRDLSAARTLPLRQNLGQFLSSFAPRDLVDQLARVEVASAENFRGEARHVLAWMKEAVLGCQRQAGIERRVSFDWGELEEMSPHTLEINWRYKTLKRFLKWDFNARNQTGHLKVDFGTGQIHQPLHLEPLSPDRVLGEALFFGG